METGAVVKWISDRKTVKKRNKTRSLKIAHQSFLSFSVGTEREGRGWSGGESGWCLFCPNASKITHKQSSTSSTSRWRLALRSRRHRHLQQAVILALAGGAVAVLGGSLDELHADFVLFELDQEPAAQTETRTTR